MPYKKQERNHAYIFILIALLAVLCLGGGISAYAYYLDSLHTKVLPAGIVWNNKSLSGMSAQDAKSFIAQASSDDCKGYTLNLTHNNETLQTVSLDGALHADNSKIFEELDKFNASRPLFSKLTNGFQLMLGTAYHRVDLHSQYSCDTQDVLNKIEGQKDKFTKNPQDAQRKFQGDSVVITPDVDGQSLDSAQLAENLSTALTIFNGTQLPQNKTISLELPLALTKAKVTAESFGSAISINLSTHKLYLYKGDKLEKTYRIGCGKPGYESPTGELKIIRKRKNPSWHNPSPEGWGAESPAVIPPGPGNPLGLRALDLNRPAIRIHGVTNPHKIGVSDSHGCINMLNPDVVDLFDRVEVGTPVYLHY